MKTRSFVMVCALSLLVAVGCKKKPSEPAPAAGSGSGSGSAVMGSGSATTEAGSGSGSGSAMAGSGSGSAMAGSGSAMAGSGSAEGSAGSGSAAATEKPAVDPEGSRHWNCKKDCKLAVSCKSAAGFHNAKECEQDCDHLAKDKDGRYERGSAMGPGYYTCIDKVTDCAGIKKCDHPK